MKRNFFVPALLAAPIVLGLASASTALPIRFETTGTGFGADPNRFAMTFDIDTSSPLTNTPPASEVAFRNFDISAIENFSFALFDSTDTLLTTLTLNDTLVQRDAVTQSRENFNNGIPTPGSNIFRFSLGFADLISSNPAIATPGSMSISFTSSPFSAGEFVSNILFDDPDVLLSNIMLDLPITRNNFSNVGSTDVFTNSSQFGSFAFDTVSVSSLNVNAVPLPASIWFMGAGLVGLFGVFRSRKSAKA